MGCPWGQSVLTPLDYSEWDYPIALMRAWWQDGEVATSPRSPSTLLLSRCAGVFVSRVMSSLFPVWHHSASHLPSIAGYLQSLFSQLCSSLTHKLLFCVVIGKAQCMCITALLSHQKPRGHPPTRSQYSLCVCMAPMEWPVLLPMEAMSTQLGEMAAVGGLLLELEMMGYW